MFRVEQLSDPLESIALEDTQAGSRVLIAPARGGLVTQFSVRDEQVLYLDRATLENPEKNVRGGVPVLFPTPGKLGDDQWSFGGHSGTLKQHGFARNLAWELVGTSTEDAAQVTLVLASGPTTAPLWPWGFVLLHHISLSGGTLRIDQHIENEAEEPMPFGLGFHPYFWLPDVEKAGARIDTAATRAWDNVARQEIELHGIELAGHEVDLHLFDHGRSDCKLSWSAGARSVELACSPEYRRWVIWTLPGRDFVCLEPWTSPGNALNERQGLIELAPHAARDFFVEIRRLG
jgi:galactose mutarotase-like enzyme